jgi:hypothetical protein
VAFAQKLGGALDDKLEAAAGLDMAALKQSITGNAAPALFGEDDVRQGAQIYGVDEDGNTDYSQTKVRVVHGCFTGARLSRPRHTASRPPVAPSSQVRVKRSMPVSTEPKVPRSEKFTLTYPQRLNLVLVLFSTAAAYGRASAGLAADPAWGEVAGSASSVAVVVSAVLGVAAAGSLGVCVRLAREKNRNAVVWGAKGLLGGPLAVTQLRGLDPL